MAAMRRDSRAPLRVVLFGSGPVLTHDARRLLARLETHPDIELVGAFCQAEGSSLRDVWQDLRRRRGILALPLFLAWAWRGWMRWVAHPRAERALARQLGRLRGRLHFVRDIHAPEVLEHLDVLSPDLGLIYGSPILRPELFEKPKLGTLGIHHGRLPDYRGNKTTFWAMMNGETEAGVTIQKINAGLDTGQILEEGRIGIAGRSLGAVWRDLENLGLDLYVRAILKVRSGEATYRPQPGPRRKLYRNPKLRDLLRFGGMRLRQRLGWHGSRDRSAAAERTPRILIFTETFYPVVGGGETQARLLAEGLVAAGCGVRLLTRRSDANLARVECLGALTVHRIPPAGSGQLKKWGLVLSGAWALARLRREYDTVFVSGFRIVGLPTVIVCRALGKTAILKADSQGEMSGKFFEAGLARFGLRSSGLPFRIFLGLRNRVLGRADAFVAITDGARDELRRAGIDGSRVHRIPNAVDTLRFSPSDPGERSELRRKLGLPACDPLAIYTGRLVSYKGLPLLVRVWAKIRESRPEARLLLVGTGGLDIHNCEAELRDAVVEAGLVDHVIFTGSVENVPAFLQASDLFVLPSEDEALPCALLEAMACALPVIATPVGAIPSIVEHEANGLLIRPGDSEGLHRALRRLLDDDPLRRRLGSAARRTVEERYACGRVTGQMLRLFGRPEAGLVRGETGPAAT